MPPLQLKIDDIFNRSSDVNSGKYTFATSYMNLSGVKIKRVINRPKTGKLRNFCAEDNSARGRYIPPFRMT